MRAGKLRHKITVQVAASTINDAGTPDVTWLDLATLRAEQVECSAEEQTLRFGDATERAIVFRTRYRGDITVADRITYEGTAFTIKKLVPDARRRTLEISALSVGT
jgi:SPP1 family predicted phage head-tail adaptor